MNKLIKMVLSYQQTKDDAVFNEIIMELDKTISFHSSKINIKYRKDLKQELLIEIYKGILKYKPENILSLESKSFDEVIKLHDKITQNKYFEYFKNKYSIDDKMKYDNILILINEFYLFCNENQFKKYIKTICEKTRIDFYRRNKIKYEINIISLNRINDDNDELLNNLIDPSTIPKSDFTIYYKLTNDDINFLNLFFEENKKFTQKDIAKKIRNITTSR